MWLAHEGQFRNGHGTGAAGDDGGSFIGEVHAVDKAPYEEVFIAVLGGPGRVFGFIAAAALPQDLKAFFGQGALTGKLADSGVHGSGTEASTEHQQDRFVCLQTEMAAGIGYTGRCTLRPAKTLHNAVPQRITCLRDFLGWKPP